MRTQAVRIAVPNVNHYVNPNSLAWLGGSVEPAESPAGQLQRELIAAAQELVAEGTRRLDHPNAEARAIEVPAGMEQAASVLAEVPAAGDWRSLVTKIATLHELLNETQDVDR